MQSESKRLIRMQLSAVRSRTLQLLNRVSDDFLRRRVHDFYSPIGWHFGHIGRTEEYWISTAAFNQPPLDPHLSFLLADTPDNPKDNRTAVPDRQGLIEYLQRTREVTERLLEIADFSDPSPLLRDGYAFSFALQHEAQHQETIAEMLCLISRELKSVSLPPSLARESGPPITWIDHPGGTAIQGTDDPFAYDNEHPAHEVQVAPFALSKYPVTAYDWSQFILDGGYQSESLWSAEGWNWRNAEQADRPEYWLPIENGYWAYGVSGPRAINPHEPVTGISWHEAQAYAQWSQARLPTEAEWEFAASIDQDGRKRSFPWGEERPSDSVASHDQRSGAPSPVNSVEQGANAFGVVGLAGGAWEWCETQFLPYPGFAAYPYDGYSKDHMKGGHRVCRGGSWATSAPILRSTFRNFYVPGYRQGFLGMRLARAQTA